MSMLGKIPMIRRYKERIDKQLCLLQEEISQLYYLNIEQKIKIKKLNGEKINVVFVCHRPAVWGSLKTVYEAMKNDSDFNVKIVTIPNKKQLPKLDLCHEIYESEGAEDFWKGNDVIQGYNYKTGQWLDLRSLKPDYIFFQQPYNIQRCNSYKSYEVSKYAKICYVEYGYNTNKEIALECIPADFIKNVSLFFLQNTTEDDWYKEYFSNIDNKLTKTYVTGFPRFDFLNKYKNAESKLWKNSHDNRFRIIWTPRWTTNENNCHFFNYKDDIFSYCKKNEDTIDFIFRPHPQAFLNYLSTHEMNEQEIENLKNAFNNSKNMTIDTTKDYLNTFYSSDCLITDYSSIVAEYFLTGKPVIYCYNKDAKINIDGEIFKGFYVVQNREELIFVLENLRNGKDELKSTREEIIKNSFKITKDGAGFLIKNIIKENFNS